MSITRKRFIAGNHDVRVTMLDKHQWLIKFSYASIAMFMEMTHWYPKRCTTWHLLILILIQSSNFEKDRKSLREFRASVKSQLYTRANLFYLEHEEFSANARSGKAWHVYGSPVRRLRFEKNESVEMHAGNSKVCGWCFPVYNSSRSGRYAISWRAQFLYS